MHRSIRYQTEQCQNVFSQSLPFVFDPCFGQMQSKLFTYKPKNLPIEVSGGRVVTVFLLISDNQEKLNHLISKFKLDCDSWLVSFAKLQLQSKSKEVI